MDTDAPIARRRGGRASVVATREAERRPRVSTIKYGIRPVEAVNADQLERIHRASLAILREIGIEFRDESAIRQWKEVGADVQDSRVRLDGDMIMSLVSKAPSSFEMTSRDPSQRFEIGLDTMTFGAMQGAPNIRDVQGIRRSSTIADLRNMNRLTQMLPGFHIAGGFTCEPTDIAVPWRHLHINHSSLVETNMPFFGLTTGQQRAEDSITMARIVHGKEFMDKNAVMMGHVSGNSPLVWDATMLEGLRAFAEANQVVLLSPFVLGAANTPADIPATIAQLNAEALAALAYTQLIKPGAKMIYGQYSVSVSMRSGAPMSGMPEVTLINAVIGQLARRYGVPWRTTASQSSAKIFDAQSGYESAVAYMSGASANANLMMHAGGWDEAGMVCCMAKFVADAEQNLLMEKYAKGISFECFEEALEAVRRIGPGGHYLGDSFTLKHFKDAFIAPEILDYLSYEQWKVKGSRDMAQRCREKAADIIAHYEPPSMDPSVREELDAFVAKRQEEISPSLA
ncbi:MAG: trimethylamine methyltransferase [Mesorhizobium sp.]|uniref:trimethylamine methyltransferase family protein n=1 Tax=Mesorhizobium sp. TaxID=1871066 RepID=UPI000FEAAA05|nr:trimethylamine methyltransferase family protein [Mesorhizobium sp.]RWE19688.1 MAG: trimethylamine methyltransferase [Mesorhizobium sp.]